MRQRTSDDAELQPVADIRDCLLHGVEQALHPLFFVNLVLLRSLFQLLPRLVWLTARGVDVDDMFSLGANGLVQQGRDEEGAQVLGVLQ